MRSSISLTSPDGTSWRFFRKKTDSVAPEQLLRTVTKLQRGELSISSAEAIKVSQSLSMSQWQSLLPQAMRSRSQWLRTHGDHNGGASKQQARAHKAAQLPLRNGRPHVILRVASPPRSAPPPRFAASTAAAARAVSRAAPRIARPPTRIVRATIPSERDAATPVAALAAALRTRGAQLGAPLAALMELRQTIATGKGAISRYEFVQRVQSYAVRHADIAAPSSAASSLFAALDVDGRGRLGVTELTSGLVPLFGLPAADAADAIFEAVGDADPAHASRTPLAPTYTRGLANAATIERALQAYAAGKSMLATAAAAAAPGASSSSLLDRAERRHATMTMCAREDGATLTKELIASVGASAALGVSSEQFRNWFVTKSNPRLTAPSPPAAARSAAELESVARISAAIRTRTVALDALDTKMLGGSSAAGEGKVGTPAKVSDAHVGGRHRSGLELARRSARAGGIDDAEATATICAGWLEVKGVVLKRWKRRHFALRDDGSLYDVSDDVEGTGRVHALRHSVVHVDAAVGRSDAGEDAPPGGVDGGGKEVFTLTIRDTVNGGRTQILRARSRTEWQLWVDGFQRAAWPLTVVDPPAGDRSGASAPAHVHIDRNGKITINDQVVDPQSLRAVNANATAASAAVSEAAIRTLKDEHARALAQMEARCASDLAAAKARARTDVAEAEANARDALATAQAKATAAEANFTEARARIHAGVKDANDRARTAEARVAELQRSVRNDASSADDAVEAITARASKAETSCARLVEALRTERDAQTRSAAVDAAAQQSSLASLTANSKATQREMEASAAALSADLSAARSDVSSLQRAQQEQSAQAASQLAALESSRASVERLTSEVASMTQAHASTTAAMTVAHSSDADTLREEFESSSTALTVQLDEARGTIEALHKAEREQSERVALEIEIARATVETLRTELASQERAQEEHDAAAAARAGEADAALVAARDAARRLGAAEAETTAAAEREVLEAAIAASADDCDAKMQAAAATQAQLSARAAESAARVATLEGQCTDAAAAAEALALVASQQEARVSTLEKEKVLAAAEVTNLRLAVSAAESAGAARLAEKTAISTAQLEAAHVATESLRVELDELTRAHVAEAAALATKDVETSEHATSERQTQLAALEAETSAAIAANVEMHRAREAAQRESAAALAAQRAAAAADLLDARNATAELERTLATQTAEQQVQIESVTTAAAEQVAALVLEINTAESKAAELESAANAAKRVSASTLSDATAATAEVNALRAELTALAQAHEEQKSAFAATQAEDAAARTVEAERAATHATELQEALEAAQNAGAKTQETASASAATVEHLEGHASELAAQLGGAQRELEAARSAAEALRSELVVSEAAVPTPEQLAVDQASEEAARAAADAVHEEDLARITRAADERASEAAAEFAAIEARTAEAHAAECVQLTAAADAAALAAAKEAQVEMNHVHDACVEELASNAAAHAAAMESEQANARAALAEVAEALADLKEKSSRREASDVVRLREAEAEHAASNAAHARAVLDTAAKTAGEIEVYRQTAAAAAEAAASDQSSMLVTASARHLAAQAISTALHAQLRASDGATHAEIMHALESAEEEQRAAERAMHVVDLAEIARLRDVAEHSSREVEELSSELAVQHDSSASGWSAAASSDARWKEAARELAQLEERTASLETELRRRQDETATLRSAVGEKQQRIAQVELEFSDRERAWRESDIEKRSALSTALSALAQAKAKLNATPPPPPRKTSTKIAAGIASFFDDETDSVDELEALDAASAVEDSVRETEMLRSRLDATSALHTEQQRVALAAHETALIAQRDEFDEQRDFALSVVEAAHEGERIAAEHEWRNELEATRGEHELALAAAKDAREAAESSLRDAHRKASAAVEEDAAELLQLRAAELAAAEEARAVEKAEYVAAEAATRDATLAAQMELDSFRTEVLPALRESHAVELAQLRSQCNERVQILAAEAVTTAATSEAALREELDALKKTNSESVIALSHEVDQLRTALSEAGAGGKTSLDAIAEEDAPPPLPRRESWLPPLPTRFGSENGADSPEGAYDGAAAADATTTTIAPAEAHAQWEAHAAAVAQLSNVSAESKKALLSHVAAAAEREDVLRAELQMTRNKAEAEQAKQQWAHRRVLSEHKAAVAELQSENDAATSKMLDALNCSSEAEVALENLAHEHAQTLIEVADHFEGEIEMQAKTHDTAAQQHVDAVAAHAEVLAMQRAAHAEAVAATNSFWSDTVNEQAAALASQHEIHAAALKEVEAAHADAKTSRFAIASGWLETKGAVLKSWKRRFFVLDRSGTLHDAPQDGSRTDRTHTTRSEVVKVTVAVANVTDFQVMKSDGRAVHQFRAPSSEMRKTWLDAIVLAGWPMDSGGTKREQRGRSAAATRTSGADATTTKKKKRSAKLRGATKGSKGRRAKKQAAAPSVTQLHDDGEPSAQMDDSADSSPTDEAGGARPRRRNMDINGHTSHRRGTFFGSMVITSEGDLIHHLHAKSASGSLSTSRSVSPQSSSREDGTKGGDVVEEGEGELDDEAEPPPPPPPPPSADAPSPPPHPAPSSSSGGEGGTASAVKRRKKKKKLTLG